jgi:predicted Zn-dependent protease
LAYSDTVLRRHWILGAIDTFAASQRRTTAAALVQTQLNDPQIPPRWLDLFLARAAGIMEPARLRGFCDSLLAQRPGEPVLRYYHAQAAWRAGDAPAAIQALDGLLADHPQALRAKLLLARVQIAQGQLDQARPMLQQLTDGTGPIAATARRELDTMLLLTPTQPEDNGG